MGDTTSEPDESFTIALSAPEGATLLRAQGTGVILNDDIQPGATPAFSVGDASTVESSVGNPMLEFSITLYHPATSYLFVNYATAAGTTTAGQGYFPTRGTLIFDPGESSVPCSSGVTSSAHKLPPLATAARACRHSKV